MRPLLVLLLISKQVWAQAPVDNPAAAGMPTLDADCPDAEELEGTAVERAGWCALARAEFVSARTLADKALREDENSLRAHLLMGSAQHLGEGNLPKALYHLERAERLFIDRFGERPNRESSPWLVYHRVLRELVYVHGEMDHHEEKIRYVDALQARLDLDYGPLKAWPLLKLKRFEEARAIAVAAAEQQNSWYRAVGLTALCAVESERRNRMAAYEACLASTGPIMQSQTEGSIELSNAGAAAEEVFKFDESERLYLEATRRPPEGSVNPWGRLVRLYVRQGRFAEGLSAWRQMVRYRATRPGSYLDQQDQSEADLIGASVMLVAGRAEDAARITARTVKRPDRQGTSSAAAEQMEAGAAVTDRVAKLEAARQLEEDAVAASFLESIKLRLKAIGLRLDAWSSTRRAADILADEERLVTSLRPECPGSIELPAWLDHEVVHVVGPGAVLAGLSVARAEESLDPQLSEPLFLGLQAEAQWASGDEAEALATANQILSLLPLSEVMLRARAAAIGADAAQDEGDTEQALRLYRIVLATDPGVLRRMGLRLPIRIETEADPAAEWAGERLLSSPRFFEADWGFVLRLGTEGVALLDGDGSTLKTAFVKTEQRDDKEALGRRIVSAAHRELLVAELDVTQADVRSLDGGLISGGKTSDRVKSILDEVSQ